MYQPVIDRLLEGPEGFSFFQAVWLLQLAYPDCQPVGFHGKADDEIVRLSCAASLSFPAAAINSIEQDDSCDTDRYRLETTNPGLYGILSPLPVNYTASLISSLDEDLADCLRLKEFLDVFNHRLLSMAYRVEEYRLFHRCSFGDAPTVVAGLYSLIGRFGEIEKTDLQVDPMFSDLATSRLALTPTRSASALTSWLESHFVGMPVSIEEFSPRWVSIPLQKQNRLGSTNCSLASDQLEFGSTAMLGEWIEDRETSFRIRLGPLKWSQFVNLLPGRSDYERLPKAVDMFLGDWFDYDLLLELAGQDCHHLQTRLDGESSQIGLTAGLITEGGVESEFQVILDVNCGSTVN